MSVGRCNLHMTYSDVYYANNVYRLCENTKPGFSHKKKRPLTRLTYGDIFEYVLEPHFKSKREMERDYQ